MGYGKWGLGCNFPKKNVKPNAAQVQKVKVKSFWRKTTRSFVWATNWTRFFVFLCGSPLQNPNSHENGRVFHLREQEQEHCVGGYAFEAIWAERGGSSNEWSTPKAAEDSWASLLLLHSQYHDAEEEEEGQVQNCRFSHCQIARQQQTLHQYQQSNLFPSELPLFSRFFWFLFWFFFF